MSADGTVVMTVSDLDGATVQEYSINIEGNSATKNQNTVALLIVIASDLETVTLIAPSDGATEVSLSETLTWEEEINASSYSVEVANDASFTQIISSGTVVSNVYETNNLDKETTYFWRVKAVSNCNESTFSTAFSFTTLVASYCTSSFVSEADHITNVTFNAINNNSENDEIDGYEDYTAINTNVERGETHQISVTFDSDGYQDNCTIFIDWNNDYIFDVATERYDLGTASGGLNTKTLDITVPNNAEIGATRMRVIIEYTFSNTPHGTGACDADHASEYGETEDYSVTVLESTLAVQDLVFKGFNLFPNPTKGAFTLSLELTDSDNFSIQLYDLRGRLIDEKYYHKANTHFSEKIFFKEASSGLYLLKVTNGTLQTTRKLIIN